MPPAPDIYGIRRRRESVKPKITIKQLAKEADVDYSFIQVLETRKDRKAERLAALLAALDRLLEARR